jgi:hypothetical protein
VAYPHGPGHPLVARGVSGDAVRRDGPELGYVLGGSGPDMAYANGEAGRVPAAELPGTGGPQVLRAGPARPGRRGGAVADPDVGALEPRRRGRGAPEAGELADADGAGRWPGSRLGWPWAAIERNRWWAVEPDVGRVAHGVPARLDRLSALGNAVVPQVAELIGRRILEAAA